MTPSFKRASRIGALGLASALALGGAVALPAIAQDSTGAVAPAADFDALAAQFFEDPAVSAVLRDSSGQIEVLRIEDHDVLELDAASALLSASADEVADANGAAFGEITITQIAAEDAIQPLATNDVVGGAGIGMGNDRVQAVCSVGYPAWSPNGDPAVITAGHCVEDFTTNWLTLPSGDPAGGGDPKNADLVVLEPAFGSTGFNQYGGRDTREGSTAPGDALDVGIIDVTNADLNLVPNMTNWTTPDDLSQGIASNITAVGQVVLDAEVHRSGRTSGYQVGESSAEETVASEGYARVSGRLVKGFGAWVTSAGGDSGGTVLQGSTAVGILSGGGVVDGRDFTWAADLQENLAYTGGYTVKLDLDEPVFTTPDAGSTVAPEAQVTGTGPANGTLEYIFTPAGAAAASADLDALVDWNNAAKVQIDGAGNFAFGGPRDPGSYEIVARATDGGFNVSDEVRLALTVAEAAPEPEPTPTEPAPEPTEPAPTEPAPTEPAPTEPAPEPSEPAIIELPPVVWTNPVDGATIDSSGTFTGEGVDGAEVVIAYNENVADVIGPVTVEAGVWSVQYEGLPAGTHELAAVQVLETPEGIGISEPAIITVTVKADAPAPSPKPTDPPLHPTGGEFGATAPVLGGVALMLVAALALMVARNRAAKANS